MKKRVLRSIAEIEPSVSAFERPWGKFKQYTHNRCCTVSLMTVQPGHRLSLQCHADRSELWIVIDDGAIVQVGDVERPYRAGEEIWIRANERHRLGAGDKSVRVLEVAFGDWRQNDIVRLADDYGRGMGSKRC